MTKQQAQQKAREIMAADSSNWMMRSCWNCNGAHEHLKEADYLFNCYDCGCWFYGGHDVTEDDEQPADGGA